MPLIRPDFTKTVPGEGSLPGSVALPGPVAWPGPASLSGPPAGCCPAAPACLAVPGDVLAFLAGTWQLARQLTDRRGGRAGHFDGQAEFLPEAGGTGLCYREEGRLVFGAHAGPASRILRYQPGPPGTADVSFTDGRPFYRLDLRTGHGQARHDCGRDCYLGEFAVLSAREMTEDWQVSGPEKDYEIRTVLRRR